MSKEETDERMADRTGRVGQFQEAVPADTGVFDEPVTGRDTREAVAEQPAQVLDLLGELRPVRKAVGLGREHQRMPTPDTDVFVHAMA